MTSHDIPRLLSVRQAQYSEPPEGAAGGLVAAGRRLQYCNIHILQKGFCGPGSLHSLQEEERPPRPWAPAGALAALMRGVALLLIKVSRAEYFLFHSSPKKRSPKQKPEKKTQKSARWRQHSPGGFQWSLLNSIENPMCPHFFPKLPCGPCE